jgi:formylglycine-generating enzyme required for sulfatase activity
MRPHHLLTLCCLFCASVFAQEKGTFKEPTEPIIAVPGPKQTESIDLGGGVTIELVLIRPGTFMMGSDNEKPVRQVTLTQPFYLGKFEVTQEQWQAVMGSNPSYFKGPKLPVANVSWDDSQNFLTKLQEKTGRNFALPTEAQWEYACRAGTTTRYSFGDDESDLAEYGWYSANIEAKTHPVGEKKPNPWGLYDMHGNAWEWCADRYGNYPSDPVSDPAGAASGISRVYRGGSWSHFASFSGCADRDWNLPAFRFLYLGLRVALSAVP